MPRALDVVIFDLDNTLWNQVTAFQTAHSALIDEVMNVTGCDRAAVIDSIVQVNKRYSVHEHFGMIKELPVLRQHFGGTVPDAEVKRLDDLYESVHAQHRKPFDKVRETLTSLRQQGIKVVLYTEGYEQLVKTRVDQLGCADLFDVIYASTGKKSERTSGANIGLRPSTLSIGNARCMAVTTESPKSDGRALALILDDLGVKKNRVIMVGDNIIRDVQMAQSVGVRGVHAKFGHDAPGPKTLYMETLPWPVVSANAKNKTSKTALSGIKADCVLKNSMAELPAYLRKLDAQPKGGPKA